MPFLLLFAFLLAIQSQFAHGQKVYPELPEQDYTVYSAVINEYANCGDTKYASRQNQLIFVNNVTEVKTRHGFSFDFVNIPQELNELLPAQSTFQNEPAWKQFIASIDTSAFTKHTLTRPIKAQCQQTQLWTDAQNAYYFSEQTAPQRGYDALQKDYENFGAIVSFSKVAYSNDRSKAVCYYASVRDGLAGSGYILFLERSGTSWKIAGRAMLWIA